MVLQVVPGNKRHIFNSNLALTRDPCHTSQWLLHQAVPVLINFIIASTFVVGSFCLKFGSLSHFQSLSLLSTTYCGNILIPGMLWSTTRGGELLYECLRTKLRVVGKLWMVMSTYRPINIPASLWTTPDCMCRLCPRKKQLVSTWLKGFVIMDALDSVGVWYCLFVFCSLATHSVSCELLTLLKALCPIRTHTQLISVPG